MEKMNQDAVRKMFELAKAATMIGCNPPGIECMLSDEANKAAETVLDEIERKIGGLFCAEFARIQAAQKGGRPMTAKKKKAKKTKKPAKY